MESDKTQQEPWQFLYSYVYQLNFTDIITKHAKHNFLAQYRFGYRAVL